MKSFSVWVIGAVAGCTILAGSAGAGMVSYDASLATPTGGSGGVYFGNGNSNGSFTIVTANGVELGLRADLREVGSVTPEVGIDTTDDTYVVPAGVDPSHKDGACTSINCAYWNFVFSVDLQPNSGLTVNNTTAGLTVLDLKSSLSTTFDPSPATVTDDAKIGSPAYAYQNSENLGFFPGAGLNDNYEIQLRLSDTNGNTYIDTIFVDQVAPEPSTWLLLLTGLAGVAFYARRRQTA